MERLESRLALAASGLPDLHSLPGAPTAIYLDFDGHGSSLGAYDVDGDPATFNAAEAATITEAHRQVSVYYAMFDVDVTTVKPDVAKVPTAWIVISNDVTGGISNVGVFPNTQPQSWIDSASARTRASGIAHEVGHNFGLLHQSDYDLQGNKTSEYSNGTDALHGALMGVDYRQDVNKWTLGHPGSSASGLQDDIAVIAAAIEGYQPAGGDGFRADDFGGTIATATALAPSAGGRSITGVIERMTDVDTFSFTASNTGAVISVVPTKPSGLDAKVEVFDATGALIAARDGDANEQQIVLPAGTGTWYVSIYSHGNYGDLGAYELSVNDLPTGWSSADIGTAGLLGDARFGGGTYTLEGSGAAIGGSADAFRFAWQRLTGDGSIVARVTQNQNTNVWARAGVEIRESLAANSKHVAMVTTAARGPQMLSRATTGSSTATVNGTSAAFTATWVRLVRAGSVITASRSADGVTWTTVGTVTVSMSSSVYIGLLSSATDAAKLNSAKFTNVTLTGTLNAAAAVNSLAAPAGVAIQQGGGASFVVSWQPVAGATGYAIERSVNGIEFSSVFTAASTATSWTNTGLAGSMRYFYRVRATSASGQSVPSAIVSGINRPSPVTNAAVTVLSNSHLVLNWIETSGETGYRIERSTDNASYTQIATVGANVPSYSVSGLAAGTQYWFRVSPMSATGDGNPVVITGITTGLRAVVGLAFTSKASSAIGISWTAVAAATSYRIERATNGTNFTTLATVAAGTVAYTDAAVAALGKYYYRVVAINGTTIADPSATIFTAAPAAVALPAPWVAADIGSVGGEGATGLQSGKFILVSSGTAIGGPADSFRFTYQSLVGDGTIVAQVSAIENTDAAAKAGVVIRESTDANARQAVMVVSAGGGVSWQYRQNVGGAGVVVAGSANQLAPVWVKLVRAGNTFTGSWSADGNTWTDVGSITIQMGSNALIGMASTSAAATLLNRAEFTNVAVSNQAPTVGSATATPDPVTGSTANLSVLGADDHDEADLTYTWTATGPAAVTFSENGTNVAKSSVATFTEAGSYTLTATIADSSGLTATTTVNVTVAQTLTAIAVSPATAALAAGGTQQFSASAIDQFGNPLTTQPIFNWSVTGGGSITTTGLFTAPATAGTSTVTATALTVTGQATVTTGVPAVTGLAFTSKASTAIGIGWNAVAVATSYRIERSTNGTSFITLATVSTGTVSYTDAAVAGVGRYYYRVIAINGPTVADASATIFTAAPAKDALPEPWIAADIGSVGGEGATGWQKPNFISISSGTAIGGPADSFRYTYQPLVGDGTIVAQVSALQNTNAAAKAGVVIRESTDANARQAVMVVSAGGGVSWQYRQNVGGSGVVVAGSASQLAPVWVKLVRAGNTFTGSWSADGNTWTDVGSITIQMGSNALIGMASTSAAATLLNRAEFTNVAVSNLAPTVVTATATPDPVTGSTATLSVLGADDHGEANLDYAWTATGPAAVAFSENGTNAAKSSVATFTEAGSYTLTATITDSSGLTVATTVNVTVSQTLTAITVSPVNALLEGRGTQQFSASASDQFGNSLTTQPSFTWAVTGGGSITTTGLFTAPATAGTSTITATAAAITGQATVTNTSVDEVVTVAVGQSQNDTGGRTGSGTLFKRGVGRLVLAGANAHSGGIVVEAGELVIRDPASLGSGVLEVHAGARVTLGMGSQRTSVSRLILSPGGTFDLATGSVLLAAGNYDLAEIRGSLVAARGNGSWLGTGITSASIQPGKPFAVGYRVLQDGSLVVGYAALGDANMDGSVDAQDLTVVSTSGKYRSGITDAAWWQGDFNYDDVVNVKDLVSMRTSGLFGTGSYLPAMAASAMPTVPTTTLMTTSLTTPSINVVAPSGAVMATVAVGQPVTAAGKGPATSALSQGRPPEGAGSQEASAAIVQRKVPAVVIQQQVGTASRLVSGPGSVFAGPAIPSNPPPFSS